MPTILLKKSDTPGSVPGTANLTNLAGGAEVAVNTADKRMFSMTSASAVIELGTNPSSLTCADASFTVARVGSLTISSLSLSNATITSATITNLTATSLTLSNNPTFSGGTANGVLYLNGSKVATSGSTLAFDSSDRLIVGAGSAVFGSRIECVANTSGDGLRIRGRASDGTGIFSFGANAAATEYARIQSDNTSALIFGTGASGTEGMRLTSTSLYTASGINVGIGTSSPGYKLTVAGASGSAVVNLLETGVRSWGLRAGGTATNTFDIADFTAGATRLTIDSSGNLGLGVTPSAWGTTKALEFSYGSFSANASLGTDVAGNCYYNGTNWIYRATGVALRYNQATAGHSWYVASGTAGNNISFGDAKMTLDASGNLGVGTTTPASGVRLHVDASGGGTIRVTRLASSATAYGQLENDGTDSTLTSTGALIFQTGSSPAPRARITSGGVFLVGTATAGYGLFSTQRVTINPNQDGIVVAPLSENFSAYTVQGNNDTGTRYAMYIANGSSTAVGNISFTSSATAYNTSSDRRLKENVDQSDDAGSLIDAIEVVKHDWKVGGHVRYGVIAQDLHDVVPEAVTVGDSEDVEALKNPWGVDYSKLVPMLVKEIQSLRARLAALESA